MKIIVYEHVSGGGFSTQTLPASILAEGYSMLRCFISDLKASGHEVTVLLDERISKLDPPLNADYTIPIYRPEEVSRFISNLAKINNAIYIIAPETDSKLQDLIKTVEATGKTSLNCQSKAISEVADKSVLYEILKKNGFNTPKTITCKVTDDISQIRQIIKKELSYPIIFKPVDGAGCSGISLIKNEKAIQRAIYKIQEELTKQQFIVQEFIKGQSVSVSLITNGKKAIVLSLNKQDITLSSSQEKSNYNGGYTPYNHRKKSLIFETAEKVVESIQGLKGYVGVDIVIGEKDFFIVDVNARLTVSYVGLHNILNFNLAQVIIDSVVNHQLPHNLEYSGFSYFSKIDTSDPTIEKYQESTKMDYVISPPFPLDNETKSCALVKCKKKRSYEAKLCLEEAKNNVHNITNG